MASEILTEHEFTDRYEALGIPYPDPETMCKGQCEGTGIYPTQRPRIPLAALRYDDAQLTPNEQEEARRWDDVHKNSTHEDGPCDGWHFIKCFDCNGTGRVTNSTGAHNVPE